MNIEERQEAIKRYVANTMLPTERHTFEQEMAQSEDLTEEVRRFQQLHVAVKYAPLIEAKLVLDAVMNDIDIEPDYGKHEALLRGGDGMGLGKWRGLLGGLVALVLVGSLFFFYQKQATKTAKMARLMALVQPYKGNDKEVLDKITNFAPDDKSPTAQAIRLYEQKQYAESARLLASVIRQDSSDKSLQLYLGVDYFLTNQTEKAIPILRGLSESGGIATVPAQWFLALSLLEKGDVAAARSQLEAIKGDTIFGERARLIIEKLR